MMPNYSHVLAIFAVLLALLPDCFANQVPIQSSKKVHDIPPIGLGLWNSKGEDVRLMV